MPNTFIDNRDRWLQMSEVDYLGQFVKAWLALNAWYRSAYTDTQDGRIIEEIKWNLNPIAARFRPLLGHTSEEAERFRNEIGALHHCLERYEIHSGKGATKTRLRLTNIVIRTEPPVVERMEYRSWTCQVERVGNGNVTVVVTKPDGTTKVNLGAHRYDTTHLNGDANFASLTTI